jgi:hypothetical protein
MSCSPSKSDQVFTNVGGGLRCHGSKMTRSNADQPSVNEQFSRSAVLGLALLTVCASVEAKPPTCTQPVHIPGSNRFLH